FIHQFIFTGGGSSTGRGIDVDDSTNPAGDPNLVYVAGDTTAADFPFTNGNGNNLRNAVFIGLNTTPFPAQIGNLVNSEGFAGPQVSNAARLHYSLHPAHSGMDSGGGVAASPNLTGVAYFCGALDMSFENGGIRAFVLQINDPRVVAGQPVFGPHYWETTGGS